MLTHFRSVAALLPTLAFFLVATGIANARPPVQLRTGSNIAIDGYLEINPDDFGAWSDDFGTGGYVTNFDRFKPTAATVQRVGFSSGFFLFAPGGRELLAASTQWQATTNGAGGPPFSADATLSRSVLSPNVASDSDLDGINDTSDSAFRVFGGATDLAFQLQQRVSSAGPGVSLMRQTYSVTNNGATSINFKMVRNFDGDLIWDASFETDSVGTSANGGAQGPFVFIQEPSLPTHSVTLSMLGATAYFGGKHGVVPGGGAPAYDFGTDTEVWDANGTPLSWINHIAGVGYNLNGQSGPAPVGSTVPRDGFIGMEIPLSLAPGASTSFTVLHTYGQTSPIPEPAMMGLLGFGALIVIRRRRA